MKSKSSRSPTHPPHRKSVDVLFLSTCFVVPVVRVPCSERKAKSVALVTQADGDRHSALRRVGSDPQRPRGMDASDRSIRER